MDDSFNQKKIKHIFHYTKSYEVLLKVIRNGFMPSYCCEKVNNREYFIPMVSFCNIALKDVDSYMHYGKYGIGMSIDWAIKNKISPVVYIHENTPFGNLIQDVEKINKLLYNKEIMIMDSLTKIIGNEPESDDYDGAKKQYERIEDLMIQLLQFVKTWKTMFNSKEIITYHEREWRYVPPLINKKRLITESDEEFIEYKTKNKKTKPHLPEHSLAIDSVEDIRYILIKHEKQRIEILKLLESKFDKENITEVILSGKLLVLTEQQINDDF